MNGVPAEVVLYQLLTEPERKWSPIDQLRDAKVVENGNGTLTITGTSHELIHTIGVDPGDAEVRWVVDPR